MKACIFHLLQLLCEQVWVALTLLIQLGDLLLAQLELDLLALAAVLDDRLLEAGCDSRGDLRYLVWFLLLQFNLVGETLLS